MELILLLDERKMLRTLKAILKKLKHVIGTSQTVSLHPNFKFLLAVN